ncbi:MAG: helix-turn-helix transcriptional regulator [Micromonosporaceae bacterium]|nr:helix-turn-helix transcriptional regulator [Micromonosporaceae bacterium]
MSAVFSHGRLRLYLLRLLADGPKHGYELIRSLENRFHGLYAPSAGTIYPRLARLEADGLVTHTASGGRKVYSITDAGRAELAARAEEVAQLEAEIRSSVADLADLAEQVEAGVRGSVRDLKQELRAAGQAARTAATAPLIVFGRGAGEAGANEQAADPKTTLVRKAAELAAEVARLVSLGRASTEDIRVASTVIDSVRAQLQHILRG